MLLGHPAAPRTVPAPARQRVIWCEMSVTLLRSLCSPWKLDSTEGRRLRRMKIIRKACERQRGGPENSKAVPGMPRPLRKAGVGPVSLGMEAAAPVLGGSVRCRVLEAGAHVRPHAEVRKTDSVQIHMWLGVPGCLSRLSVGLLTLAQVTIVGS